jgi:predicted secreted protein
MKFSLRESIALLLLWAYGCDLGEPLSSDPQLHLSLNGRFLTYSVNRPFSLELDLNADAGYSWDCTISDSTVIRLEKTTYRPKSGDWNVCGGMTVETFLFRTTKPGECTISLAERQAWMPEVPPINSFQVTVIVYR